ncbi:MAG: hypothetical protein SFU86_17165 [Pirellulaceae bacterium]|nr:hypothetical protein [Pirellulaceae bacterium]
MSPLLSQRVSGFMAFGGCIPRVKYPRFASQGKKISTLSVAIFGDFHRRQDKRNDWRNLAGRAADSWAIFGIRMLARGAKIARQRQHSTHADDRWPRNLPGIGWPLLPPQKNPAQFPLHRPLTASRSSITIWSFPLRESTEAITS